jgi:hypothetical protein
MSYNWTMDSLQDLLGRYSSKEPEEVTAVKRYIANEFGAESSVGLQGESLMITVTSASLANALRLRLPALQKVAGGGKKIRFRIG